ncbi:MAG: hypothetical protein D6771_05090 [Zetaproteobacteria bacterium]|nr:MAG: hypothetical protein D6771_05090 [Zetaproteobacteria bacterium]
MKGKEARVGMRWFNVWVYVLLPLGALLGLVGAFLVYVTTEDVRLRVLAVDMMLANAALSILVSWGLHGRRLWAWYLNWLYVVFPTLNGMEHFVRPDASFVDTVGEALLGLALATAIWGYPNYLYWMRRRHLFAPAAQEERDGDR